MNEILGDMGLYYILFSYFDLLKKSEQDLPQYKNILQTCGVHVRTTSGLIFSADVWIRGGQVIFQYKI